MADHKRIWLQHPNDVDAGTGRLWCENKVWPEAPEDGEPTEYVRADIAADLAEALADLRKRFHQALILSGTDPEYADIACAKADAALLWAKGE